MGFLLGGVDFGGVEEGFGFGVFEFEFICVDVYFEMFRVFCVDVEFIVMWDFVCVVEWNGVVVEDGVGVGLSDGNVDVFGGDEDEGCFVGLGVGLVFGGCWWFVFVCECLDEYDDCKDGCCCDGVEFD